jgi:hypothetical protein
MKALCLRVALPVATAGTPGIWLGRRRLMAIDGVMIDIPDNAENRTRYPKAVGGVQRIHSGRWWSGVRNAGDRPGQRGRPLSFEDTRCASLAP